MFMMNLPDYVNPGPAGREQRLIKIRFKKQNKKTCSLVRKLCMLYKHIMNFVKNVFSAGHREYEDEEEEEEEILGRSSQL